MEPALKFLYFFFLFFIFFFYDPRFGLLIFSLTFSLFAHEIHPSVWYGNGLREKERETTKKKTNAESCVLVLFAL